MQKTRQQNLFKEIPNDLQETDLWGTRENGETVVIPVYLNKPKNKSYPVKWLPVWQDDAEGTGMSLIEQAADKRFTATDFRVRDYLLCKVGIGNFVHISQTEAAEYLGIAQPHISTSIRKLIDMGIVLEGPSKGRFKTYQINPSLAFQGNLGEGVQKRKEAIKQSKAKVIPFHKGGELHQGSLLE
jgi:hypothetical protein